MTEELFSNRKNFSESDEWRVIGWIALKGSSCTNEIADTLEYDLETMKSIIKSLLKKQWIFRITIDENNLSPFVMCRLSELHSKGITQMKQFQERNFYALTEKGFDAYMVKFKGQHKRANNCYLQYVTPLEDNTETISL